MSPATVLLLAVYIFGFLSGYVVREIISQQRRSRAEKRRELYEPGQYFAERKPRDRRSKTPSLAPSDREMNSDTSEQSPIENKND